MNKEPAVTVVIPTYNRGAVLTNSVQSVLDQSYDDLEVIVVDDGSTDQTREVVRKMDDPRICYVYQPNAGACAARNHGAALARGKYVAFHDSDDVWHADKPNRQMEKLQETGADVVVCRMIRLGKNARATCYPKRIGEGFLSIKNDLFGIGTQTILAKKEVVNNIDFRPELPRYQDLEWFIHALEKYRIYCMKEAMVDYCIGGDSISKEPERMYEAFVLFQRYYPNLRTDSPALCIHIVRDLLGGWIETMHENPAASGKFLRLAQKYIF